MKNLQKVVVFTLTFLAYAGLHCLREGWAYSKPELQKQFNLQQSQLGLVDTLYLVSYSLGMATIGNLSSKINLRLYISIGMLIACAFYVSFSLLYLFSHIFNYVFLIIAMSLNGFFQSTGWPGVMGIMGNWFGKGKRGLLMGFWSINANVGNIIASVMCNIIQEGESWPWTSNFIFTACFTAGIAVLVLIFIKQKPEQQIQKQQSIIQKQNQNSDSNLNNQLQDSLLTKTENQTKEEEVSQKKPKNINVFTALCLPRVPLYVLSYSLMKGCVYGLLFWLPSYLDQKGLGAQKGFIASMFDIGAFIGGLIVGYLGDKYEKRALFLSPLLILGGAMMFIVSFTFTNIAWMYYCAMLIIGILTGGPYNIIGSAITLDLGEQAGKQNIGKVSALIQGCGAIYAAISQLIISVMPFEGIFYLFSCQCIIASLAVLPLFIKDLKSLKKK